MHMTREKLIVFLKAAGLSAVLPALLFGIGYVRVGSGIGFVFASIAFVLATAALLGVFHAARCRFWWAGMLFGYLTGLAFAADLLFEVTFEGQYFVASATFMYFVALGFMLGMIAEFIHVLHHVFHGGFRKWKCAAENGDRGRVARK